MDVTDEASSLITDRFSPARFSLPPSLCMAQKPHLRWDCNIAPLTLAAGQSALAFGSETSQWAPVPSHTDWCDVLLNTRAAAWIAFGKITFQANTWIRATDWTCADICLSSENYSSNAGRHQSLRISKSKMKNEIWFMCYLSYLWAPNQNNRFSSFRFPFAWWLHILLPSFPGKSITNSTWNNFLPPIGRGKSPYASPVVGGDESPKERKNPLATLPWLEKEHN